MSISDWITALGLFVTYPLLLIATFIAMVAAFGFAWWLRGHIKHGQIDGLTEQLRLARSQYDDVNTKLSELKDQVTAQQKTIVALRSSLPPAAQVESLARSNNEIQTALTSLAHSTSHLGHTLTIGEGLYRVMFEPLTRP